MIERKTVFILGAGAHTSYGFPTGEQLKAQIVERLRADRAASDSVSTTTALALKGRAKPDDVTSARAEAMADALERAGQASIDAFLNANHHLAGYGILGKCAIAQILIEFENKVLRRAPDIDGIFRLNAGKPLIRSNDDWLEYLFRYMLDGCATADEFTRRNNVSFVTFNYDRLLESWLLERIQHSFGLRDGDALAVQRQIPIHHVYGTLGDFPVTSRSRDRMPWIDASENIRLIFEAKAEHEEVARAREALKSSECYCLLGFGFHRENIELLDLAGVLKGRTHNAFASRYGFTETEWNRIGRLLPGGTPQALPNLKCLGTLRELPVF